MAGVRRMSLGSQGLEISAQGLGCMGMSAFYGPPKPDSEMIQLIHHAINKGITLLDTSDMYGPFTNEILLGKALKGGYREKVQLATKFGVCFVDGNLEVRGDPAYVRAACEASLKRLDVDYIDLYYQHRIDTKVPIEATMGELKKLVAEGKIKYVGLSEASASTIRRAHAVQPITAVQLEWSLWTRDIEEDVIPTCRELGIGIVTYSPLGRGFLSTGPAIVDSLPDDDFRKTLPRFQAENLEHNKKMFERVTQMAESKGCTTSQLALAWVHHRGSDVCPIPGTTKIANLDQNIGALSVKLSAEELAELESIASVDNVKGDRYADGAPTTWRDSETPPLSSWKGFLHARSKYWVSHRLQLLVHSFTSPWPFGKYLALTGARLNGKELVAAGLATHFVPSEKFPELEKRLIELNSGDELAVKEFALDVKPDEDSILHKQTTIDKCFSKGTVEKIIKSFETEAISEGNGWINAVLKGLKRSSLTGLKITLSIRKTSMQELKCLATSEIESDSLSSLGSDIRNLTL